jgi:hypothetical protein
MDGATSVAFNSFGARPSPLRKRLAILHVFKGLDACPR